MPLGEAPKAVLSKYLLLFRRPFFVVTTAGISLIHLLRVPGLSTETRSYSTSQATSLLVLSLAMLQQFDQLLATLFIVVDHVKVTESSPGDVTGAKASSAFVSFRNAFFVCYLNALVELNNDNNRHWWSLYLQQGMCSSLGCPIC